MFLTFLKKLPRLFISSQFLFLLAIENLLLPSTIFATVIQVTTNDGGFADGGLNAALQQAQNGDTIDCSPIAGQTINLATPLPALVNSSLTISGSGVTIDGGSTFPAFSLAQGSATITDLTIQNGLSRGGEGGSGHTGGGGGTGGGGALYIHSGTTMTISTISLNNNQALGGAGGAGNATGGSGGGGGGFGGGGGGEAILTGTNAGSAGGGGGNNGGVRGGRDGGVGTPNSFPNFAGAGGGGQIPGNSGAKAGGSAAATSITPARSGGGGGIGSVNNGAGAGGGAGPGGSGFHGSNSIDESGNGQGGAGGLGVGSDNTYGAGGGGGGGNGGGAGYGTSGGGGGLNGPGGVGGTFGGGGGASSSKPGNTRGGNGGFGAGGGGGNVGGIDTYGIGGAGGSATDAPAGGGGGSGLGGAIFIQQGGSLIIQDGVAFSDNSTAAGMGGIAAGIGSSGENGSSLGQDIFIQAGGNVTLQINDALMLSNPIEGAGLLSEVSGPGVIKSGTGTVSLTGANTYLGDTVIQAGTLNLNGSVSENLYIEPGGTLSGNATVNGNIYNNGTISPGNSIGEIFTTNLFLFPTSVYTVEINSAGESDIITASGFAQLGGGVVVSPDDLNFTTPRTYTIISTSTGVTGEFSSLTSSVPSLMNLMYDPLTVQLTYLPLTAISLTGNALNAACCFATLPALPGSDVATVNNALLALNFDGIQEAFKQMSPAQFSGPTQVQLLDAILVRSSYTKHMQKFCFNKDQLSAQLTSLWIDGIAQWQKQKNQFGYKDTTLGATIGIDYCIRNWLLGLAFSSTHDHFHGKHFGGKAIINNYYGGFYGRWNCDRFYINTALLGARNKYRTTRQLSFGTINRHTHSKHKGNELLAHVGFGYQVCPSLFQLTPYINLDYVLQHEHRYTESGADSLNLHVNRKKSMLFQAEAGVSLSTSCHACNGVFIPTLTMAYINQTPCSSKNYHANFVNSSCVFTGSGGNYNQNLFATCLALTYQNFDDSVNVSIYYDAQIGSRYWAQDIVFGLTVRF